MHPKLIQVTQAIEKRSSKSRHHYLNRLEHAKTQGPYRGRLNCTNLAHSFAACKLQEKDKLKGKTALNIAIISAYNDLLSAHQPYENYPTLIKEALAELGAVGQFAGGVPAMCDGITQGQDGMELSLLSRDIVALSALIGLSHNLFDGALMLGICDKIVPGLLIAALRFGHLPFIFIPAGPMPSSHLGHGAKAKIRELYAQDKATKAELLETEAAVYHAPGTCTFYGTANSNQLLVEMLGLHLPGASFINPNTKLRSALTKAAAQRLTKLSHLSEEYLPIGQLINAKSIVNAMVGLLASGGSSNHTLHLIAIARAAGLIINWDDFALLSSITPLIAKIYPNGPYDINHFEQAGGMALFFQNLLDANLLHEEVHTVHGFGLQAYTCRPILEDNRLTWVEGLKDSRVKTILRSTTDPFQPQGGLRVLSGNLGRAILKTSALVKKISLIKAKAAVFLSQEDLKKAFEAEELNHDLILVLPFQGPKACGMPELHQLSPILTVLQNRGFTVALITDGRMSGASGSVPAVIHLTPEALDGGLIGKIKTGDPIEIDLENNCLSLLVSPKELNQRQALQPPRDPQVYGLGRELFQNLRLNLSSAELGACSLFNEELDLHA